MNNEDSSKVLAPLGESEQELRLTLMRARWCEGVPPAEGPSMLSESSNIVGAGDNLFEKVSILLCHSHMP